MIIAVDGPAAAGKGTLARKLAQHFALAYLDSGALYRAVARDVMAAGKDLRAPEVAAAAALAIDPSTLDDPGLRTQGVGEAASIVAKFPEVREALLVYQRSFSVRGAVIDGRDIGTIVYPDADIKLFVTASCEERARRRTLELREGGAQVSYESVLADVRARDERDRSRDHAPLRAAEDAHLLDTTNLGIEAAYGAAVEFIDAKLSGKGT